MEEIENKIKQLDLEIEALTFCKGLYLDELKVFNKNGTYNP